MRLREGGITQVLFEKRINNHEKAICDDQKRAIVTDIEPFYGILMAILLSFVVGFLILIIELFLYKYIYNVKTGRFEFKKLTSLFALEKHHLNTLNLK